jgi:hypothetical protein
MNRTALVPGADRRLAAATAEPVRRPMMNDRTRVVRRSRRAGPQPAWTAAAITATAALALLAAACRGSPPSTGSGGSPSAGGAAHSKLVAFSHCMALARRAELARPIQQPIQHKVRPRPSAAIRGQQLPVQYGPESLPAPAPGRRQRHVPRGHDAADSKRHAEIQPVRALSRGAELARPHHQ